jgi:hypothetical protein
MPWNYRRAQSIMEAGTFSRTSWPPDRELALTEVEHVGIFRAAFSGDYYRGTIAFQTALGERAGPDPLLTLWMRVGS